MYTLLALAISCFTVGLVLVLRTAKELKIPFALFDIGRALLSIRSAI